MAHEYPAPEQRVRDYLEALTEQHGQDATVDTLYVGGSARNPSIPLEASDLRDVLGELEEARHRLESLDH